MRAFSSRVSFSRAIALFALLGGLGACDGAAGPTDGGTTPADGGPPQADAGGGVPPAPETLGPTERPAQLIAPRAHDGVTPLPAVFLLHGFGASGAVQDAYFGLSRAARSRGFYVVVPDGTVNTNGQRFWNATPACCDFGGSGVDDVAYLTSLIDELEAAVPVSAVYFVGHSNGGFMSYRMACERSARVSAVVSLAGSDFLSDDDCVPAEAVSVLQIHGDLDGTILYGGAPGYPSAADVVTRWAGRAGCDTSASVAGEPLDLDSSVDGAETTILRYEAGCTGAQAELWSIVGGGHIPAVNSEFSPAVLDWLAAH
jgi:polyhydroxybutyrate depolymerase